MVHSTRISRSVMGKIILSFIVFLTIYLSQPSQKAQAQSIKLVGQNTLNGAINGVLLGGATMALKDNEDFAPVRIGLGAGTLYGIGVGIYDVSQIDKGQQFYLSGTFNDATNSSIIPLLDTLYGAAGGALIASSVSLIIKEPFVEALQYGSGIGAWAGFGFGLVDAFILAEGPNFARASVGNPSNVSGFITYTDASSTVEVGLISPDMIEQKELSSSTFSSSVHPAVQVMNVSISL